MSVEIRVSSEISRRPIGRMIYQKKAIGKEFFKANEQRRLWLLGAGCFLPSSADDATMPDPCRAQGMHQGPRHFHEAR